MIVRLRGLAMVRLALLMNAQASKGSLELKNNSCQFLILMAMFRRYWQNVSRHFVKMKIKKINLMKCRKSKDCESVDGKCSTPVLYITKQIYIKGTSTFYQKYFFHYILYMSQRATLRIELQVYPSLYFTSLANHIHLDPDPSYLRILNSLQLIKFNTQTGQSLRIGESFYLYFHFTNQYLYYDQLQGQLVLSRNPEEKTTFKIITNELDWTNRGYVEVTNKQNFKYRIILAQNNLRFIRNENGVISLGEEADNYSLFSIKWSLYGFDLYKSPIRLIRVENNLKLSCKGMKQIRGEAIPTISQSIFNILIDGDNVGFQHVLTGKILIEVDGQFCTVRQTQYVDPFLFRMISYDHEKKLYIFQLNRDRSRVLTIPSNFACCELSEKKLQNVFKIGCLKQEEMMNIVPFAWFQMEREQKRNKLTADFIINECYYLLERLTLDHQEEVAKQLLNQGLLGQFEFFIDKYRYESVLNAIKKMILFILEIRPEFIIELFKYPTLYHIITEHEDFIYAIQNIKLDSTSFSDKEALLQTIQGINKIINIGSQLTLGKLSTLLALGPVYKEYPKECSQLKSITKSVCEQIVDRLSPPIINLYYLMGLKLLRSQTSKNYFYQNVIPQLSLSALSPEEEDGPEPTLKAIIMYIQILWEQKPLVINIINDSESGPLAKNYMAPKIQPHLKAFSFFVDEVLAKNCRFQTYNNKVISLCISRYYCDVNSELTLIDCRSYIRNLLQNLVTFSFYEHQPYEFLQQLTSSLRNFVKKLHKLLCENNLTYDSLTTNSKDRVLKCEEQFSQIMRIQCLNHNILWDFLLNPSTELERSLNIWMNIFLLMHEIGNSHSILSKHIKEFKIMTDPGQQFEAIIELFKDSCYIFQLPTLTKKILNSLAYLSRDQIEIITSIIDENNLYSYFCAYHSDENLCKLLIQLMNTENSELNGLSILNTIVGLKKEWKYSQNQFNLMKSLLHCIGGIISLDVYHTYSEYIYGLAIENYTNNFLKLCQVFFSLTPQPLKKEFVMNYLFRGLSMVKSQKIANLLQNQSSQFIYNYIQMMSAFSQYHPSPDILYDLVGDQVLMNFLLRFPSIQLKLVILKFVVKSRARGNGALGLSHEDKFVTPEDLQFLNEGTHFIRNEIKQVTEMNENQLLVIREYICDMIDFLQLRQQLIENVTNISENQHLTIEGTNKLLAFELIDLIEVAINTEEIKKQILEKILWLQAKYKVNVNSVQLTNIAVSVESGVKNKENFQFNYQLNQSDSLREPIKYLISLMGLQSLLAYLIRIISIQSFRKNVCIQLSLNYLHYLITHHLCYLSEKNIHTMFLVYGQLVKNKNYNGLSKLQNILRKSLMIQGQINKDGQILLQNSIMSANQLFFYNLHDILDQYVIFSPIYTHSANYFTAKGSAYANWTVTSYISMLRFLNILSKSLNFQFKRMFSQKGLVRKEFLGRIIEINREHLKGVDASSSSIKLTIIVYELELINNLLRGPVEENIKNALQFEYYSLCEVLKLRESEKEEEEEKIKLMIRVKKMVSESILLMTSYHSYEEDKVHLIQETIIEYYHKCTKIYGEKNTDKIIIDYAKQNKNQLKIMYFDLSLNIFYCLVKIYERNNNKLITKLKTQQLHEVALKKSYGKRFKMFYQIYRVFKDLFLWIGSRIYKCCCKTDSDEIKEYEQNTHEENLTETIKFFVGNVANVQIKVDDKIISTYFLLLKEARAYNTSIRKEMHRRVGLAERQYRLKRFLQVTNFIIMRLQIEKNVRSFTQKYKLIDVIIKNRQLWKSLNFGCACVLNYIFLLEHQFNNSSVPLAIVRCLSYIFSLLLFTIYFVQNLPIKREMAKIKASESSKSKLKYVKSCLQLFNDKTLWFASIYFIVISLSFIQLSFVALLMIDFFVRFKISKKVTQIVTKPIVQLILIVLFSVQVAYLYTAYQAGIGAIPPCPNASACVQLIYQNYLGLQKNLDLSDEFLQIEGRQFADFYFRFFNIMINNSLIISVLLYEKKSRYQKQQDWDFRVKKKCFICDGERSEIDRSRNNNNGFFQHIEEQHNLWNYVFYLIYLKNKNPELLDAIETMIVQKWTNAQIQWLPDLYKQY